VGGFGNMSNRGRIDNPKPSARRMQLLQLFASESTIISTVLGLHQILN
jgi:hypothetical protein